MHEVVTLQLGQRANYLATHFWNLQVISFDSDLSLHSVIIYSNILV
jgi:hypothetical protein